MFLQRKQPGCSLQPAPGDPRQCKDNFAGLQDREYTMFLPLLIPWVLPVAAEPHGPFQQ